MLARTIALDFILAEQCAEIIFCRVVQITNAHDRTIIVFFHCQLKALTVQNEFDIVLFSDVSPRCGFCNWQEVVSNVIISKDGQANPSPVFG